MIKSEILNIQGILVSNEPTEENLREACIVALDYNTPVILRGANGVQHTVDPRAILGSISRSVAPDQRRVDDWSDEPGLTMVKGAVR